MAHKGEGEEPRGPRRGPRRGSCEGTWPLSELHPDEIPEERFIRKSRTDHLTDSGADSRPVHLDQGC